MRKIQFSIVIVALALCHSTMLASSGWLHVRVIDDSGARIPGQDVVVSYAEKQGGRGIQAMTDIQGESHFSLAPGMYSVRVSGPNLLEYRRATVEVRASDHRSIVVRPQFIPTAQSRDVAEARIKYKRVVNKNNGYDMLIRHANVTRTPDGLVYNGDKVEVSFQTVTMDCVSLFCHSDFTECVCNGLGLVYVGTDEVRGEQCAIKLYEATMTIRRSPNIKVPMK